MVKYWFLGLGEKYLGRGEGVNMETTAKEACFNNYYASDTGGILKILSYTCLALGLFSGSSSVHSSIK